jgi:hypothetical protein
LNRSPRHPAMNAAASSISATRDLKLVPYNYAEFKARQFGVDTGQKQT